MGLRAGRATDADSGSGTTTLTVHNVTPSVKLNSVADISENDFATVTGSYTDIGLLDAHVVTVNWDDPNNGLASTFAVGAIRNAAGTATLHVGDTFNSSTDSGVLTITSINAATGQVGFSVQHQYLDDGIAPGNNTASDASTIGVTVADDDADVPGGLDEPAEGEPLAGRDPADDGQRGDVGVAELVALPGPLESALAEPRVRVLVGEEGSHGDGSRAGDG